MSKNFELKIIINLLLGLGLVLITYAPSPVIAQYDCCDCRLESGPNGCTVTNNNCTAQCPTNTPIPFPTSPPSGPTNTPHPGSTATPVPPGVPTPTQGACNTICDINCSAAATAPVWSSWGWPANSPKCCLVCGAADWCQCDGLAYQGSR